MYSSKHGDCNGKKFGKRLAWLGGVEGKAQSSAIKHNRGVSGCCSSDSWSTRPAIEPWRPQIEVREMVMGSDVRLLRQYGDWNNQSRRNSPRCRQSGLSRNQEHPRHKRTRRDEMIIDSDNAFRLEELWRMEEKNRGRGMGLGGGITRLCK